MTFHIHSFRRCRKLPKALREWQAFLDLKKKIDDFSDTCPLLELMSNKAMKERHWDRISTVGYQLVSGIAFNFLLTPLNRLAVRENITRNLLFKFFTLYIYFLIFCKFSFIFTFSRVLKKFCIKSKIQKKLKYQRFCNILTYFCDLQVTKHQFDVENESFTLRGIMEAPLLQFKEDIEDICIAAGKEKDIEAKLKQVN